MAGYLASFVWRREVRRCGGDTLEEFLKLIRLENMTEDLTPLVTHDHDHCIVLQTDHNYCEQSPWDHDYYMGAITLNDSEKVPQDHNYNME